MSHNNQVSLHLHLIAARLPIRLPTIARTRKHDDIQPDMRIVQISPPRLDKKSHSNVGLFCFSTMLIKKQVFLNLTITIS